MNQRAKPHAAPGTPSPAAGRAEWRRTGLKGSTGVHPRRGRRPIPRRGAGERGSEPLLQRPHPCSSPLTLRAAATRRLTVPGPRLRLLTLPSPPASAGLQLPVSRAAPTRAAPSPPLPPLPAAARRAEGAASRVSAARVSRARRKSWQWAGRGWGWGTGRGERGATAVPPPAGGREQEAAAAAQLRSCAWALTSPKGPTEPRAAGGGGSREDGGEAGGQEPKRPA